MSPFLFGWILIILAATAFDMRAYTIALVTLVLGLLNILAAITP